MEVEDLSTFVTYQYNTMGEEYISNKSDAGAKALHALVRQTVKTLCGSLENKVVIDAGCGHGLDIDSYLAAGASAVLAFDPSSLMLSKVQYVLYIM